MQEGSLEKANKVETFSLKQNVPVKFGKFSK